MPQVDVGEFVDAHAAGQPGGDDRPGGRAGDEIEVVAQPEVDSSAVTLPE